MSAPAEQTQRNAKKSLQENLELTKGPEMRPAIGTVKVWMSEALGDSIGTRFLRAVALGALLVAATTLYFSVSQGEAGSSASSSEARPAVQAPAYLDSGELDVAEPPYDELSRGCFGFTSPSAHCATDAHLDPAE